jgi:hypothetical protein
VTRLIEIVIAPDGQTRLETKGFSGESCRDASRFIEDALGQRVGEQLTAEFHRLQSQTQNDQLRS